MKERVVFSSSEVPRRIARVGIPVLAFLLGIAGGRLLLPGHVKSSVVSEGVSHQKRTGDDRRDSAEAAASSRASHRDRQDSARSDANSEVAHFARLDEVKRLSALADKARLDCFSKDGWFSPGMAKLLGLDEAQVEAVQGVYDRMIARRQEDLKTRLKVTEEKGPDGKPTGLVKFEIPHDDARDQGYDEALRREFSEAAGPLAADVMMWREKRFLSDFAKYDIVGTIRDGGKGLEVQLFEDGERFLMNRGPAAFSSIKLGDVLDAYLQRGAGEE